MEHFLREVKDNIFIDFDLEELKNISEATENLLERLSKSAVKVNPLFEVKRLVPCGSMAEKSRNWKFTGGNREPVIEFDFLAILANPPQKEISLSEQCDGFRQIVDKNQRLKRYCNTYSGVGPQNSLLGDKMSFSFQTDLLKSVNHLCNCFKFDTKMKILQKDICCKYVVQGTVTEEGSGCEKCTEYKDSGYLQIATGDEVGSPYYNHSTLVLKWTSASYTLRAPDLVNFAEKKCINHLYVLVDFLPSFEILKKVSTDDGSNETSFLSTHEFFLVPKTCPKSHASCWKVSNCAKEVDFILSASQEHRFVYMILKFMSDCMFSSYYEDGTIPTTYRIKTAVLHHIKSCSVSREPKLFNCVKQVLIEMSDSFKHQSLPNFINGFNLLSVNMLLSENGTESLPIQNKIWHQNRCRIVGECYKFVSELFEDSHNQVLGLETGVRLLKCVGRIFFSAWTATEFQHVYVVDAKKLMSKIEKELAKCQSFIDINDDTNTRLVIRQDFSNVHWTKTIGVWEYKNIRKLFGRYHFEYTDPPGKSPGNEETILSKAKECCGYYRWKREDQKEWIAKLENSGSPNDIVTALKSVGIYYIDIKSKQDTSDSKK